MAYLAFNYQGYIMLNVNHISKSKTTFKKKKKHTCTGTDEHHHILR